MEALPCNFETESQKIIWMLDLSLSRGETDRRNINILNAGLAIMSKAISFETERTTGHITSGTYFETESRKDILVFRSRLSREIN
jgi:hypothetical protein